MNVEEAVKLVVSAGIVTLPDRSHFATPTTTATAKDKNSKKPATKKLAKKQLAAKKTGCQNKDCCQKTGAKTKQAENRHNLTVIDFRA